MDHKLVSFDKVSFRLAPVYRRIWYQKGQKPRSKFFWCNKKINIFGALLDNGELIFDNASLIKNYLSKFSNIKVEYLAPYYPQLNRIETTRFDVTNSNCFPTIDKLKERLKNYWKRNNFKLNFINYLCL